MKNALERLETSLNALRAEYRQLRNKKEEEAIRIRIRIRQLEMNFENILAADMEKLSHNDELVDELKTLSEEAGNAVEIINQSMENIDNITEVINKIDSIIIFSYEIVKKIA